MTDHVASEFDRYFDWHENAVETGVVFYLLILIPIICVVRFLFQFTKIAKSHLTSRSLILLICSYQMSVYIASYLFFLVSGLDPLVLIQRHYESLLGILLMTILMSLLCLGCCFIILHWKYRYHNILSSLCGIGSVIFHFYCCILKPALMDGKHWCCCCCFSE